jgi:type I restriction enzyme, R subunit
MSSGRVTLPILETVRRRLRPLMKLIEYKKRPVVLFGFRGSIRCGNPDGHFWHTRRDRSGCIPTQSKTISQTLRHHIAVLKVRRNEPLTPTDLKELERIFIEAGADHASLAAVQADGGLVRFVRSLVGLDREAAKQAFSEFLVQRNLTANQNEFLNLIIDHLTARGVMDPRLLYEAPFTDFDSKGVEGVFEHADAVRLVDILRGIEARPAA